MYAVLAEKIKSAILDLLPIPEGSLPAKYLGEPLISTRLKYDDSAIEGKNQAKNHELVK